VAASRILLLFIINFFFFFTQQLPIYSLALPILFRLLLALLSYLLLMYTYSRDRHRRRNTLNDVK
jgi:hypothetical protein